MATTEELMSQYGVAWFTFDEASGAIIDKLGSGYKGTVTGATRTSGWNGEGNALSFNGSSNYVTMSSNTIVPLAEKTIRFKMKLSKVNTSTVIIGNSAGYDFKGFRLYLNSASRLSYYQTHEGSSSASAVTAVGVKQLTEIDKWYDIMVTRTSDNIVSFYINEELDSVTFMTKGESAPSSNIDLLLGRRVYHDDYHFAGQLDDFQIYNKALTPQDFTHNFIAIKTSNNKTLALTNKEKRVKELPSTDETDLINQAYVWREIDDAVDGGIDLSQTTTEYEVFSKTNSTLGNGKVFTIPVNDFKTIKIEDNY